MDISRFSIPATFFEKDIGTEFSSFGRNIKFITSVLEEFEENLTDLHLLDNFVQMLKFCNRKTLSK